MRTPLILGVLFFITLASYAGARKRALALAGGRPAGLKSLPSYHGAYAAIAAALPALTLIVLAVAIEPWALGRWIQPSLPADVRAMDEGLRSLWLADVERVADAGTWDHIDAGRIEVAATARRLAHGRRLATVGLAVAMSLAAVAGALLARRRISVEFPARAKVERVVRLAMLLAATVAVLTTGGIVLSLVAETARFFERVPIGEFLFGLRWSPQTALRADQVGSSGSFGAVPLFVGTGLITAIAMCVAVPLGLFAAVFTSEYAGPRARAVVKPLLELLAGVPTVVYGFFAALVVAPALRSFGARVGLDVASESALAAGVVMGIMIIPFISSLSDDVMNAVPQSLRDGAYALGATKSETIRQIILPAALPGIAGAVLLAMSRAIGETMIVVMAAGLAANLTVNPLAAVTTVTVQIVTLLVGDQEFDSAKTLAAFALGLVLFAVTLCLNVAALTIVRRYRERYD